MLFYQPKLLAPFFLLLFCLSSFLLWAGIIGQGVFRLNGCLPLSPSFALQPIFTNNNCQCLSCIVKSAQLISFIVVS